jgi:hypothetical protein
MGNVFSMSFPSGIQLSEGTEIRTIVTAFSSPTQYGGNIGVLVLKKIFTVGRNSYKPHELQLEKTIHGLLADDGAIKLPNIAVSYIVVKGHNRLPITRL